MGLIERNMRAVTGNRTMSSLLAASLALLLFALCAPVFGQERFGEINGVITDPSNSAIPNARVTLTNKDINKSITLVSTSLGAYIATDLEPGRYRIRVEATGFTASEIPDVNVLVGKTLKVDIKLNVGSTTETVQVTEAAPLIDTTGNTVAHNITSEEFDRLPKARTF